MVRKYPMMLVLIMLAGCMSFDVLDAELPKYHGRPVDSLVARLGYPNAEQVLMGQKVYVWNTSQQRVSVTPTTSTTTGYVGYAPVSTTTYGSQTNVTQLSCMIRVFVDQNDIIRSTEYSGNNGACFTYSERLEG